MRYLWGPRWARSERAGGRVLGLRRYATRWGSKGSPRRAMDTCACVCACLSRAKSAPVRRARHLRFSARFSSFGSLAEICLGDSFADAMRRETRVIIYADDSHGSNTSEVAAVLPRAFLHSLQICRTLYLEFVSLYFRLSLIILSVCNFRQQFQVTPWHPREQSTVLDLSFPS